MLGHLVYVVGLSDIMSELVARFEVQLHKNDVRLTHVIWASQHWLYLCSWSWIDYNARLFVRCDSAARSCACPRY